LPTIVAIIKMGATTGKLTQPEMGYGYFSTKGKQQLSKYNRGIKL
jgi:hypothetical protein